jgi:hypothetical protein
LVPDLPVSKTTQLQVRGAGGPRWYWITTVRMDNKRTSELVPGMAEELLLMNPHEESKFVMCGGAVVIRVFAESREQRL